MTYVNTSFFIVFLILVIARRSFRLWRRGKLSQVTSWQSFVVYMDAHGRKEDTDGRGVPTFETEGSDEEQSTQRQRLLDGYYDADHQPTGSTAAAGTPPAIASKLGFYETARLSLQFCMLWFLANYFALACLQYTTVGSTTILTSTSGVWTLLFGAFIGVERLTIRKVIGVVASLVGVILISRVDVSSSDEKTPTPTSAEPGKNEGGTLGSFPHKTPAEIALGDAMAAFSAIMYGVYTIVMKKQVGDESRVNMQLFFGLVGFFNVFLLWPGFIIMHLTGLETFTLPPTERIWTIILVCCPFFSLAFTSVQRGWLMMSSTDKLYHIPYFRYVLGICNASNHAPRGHRWPQPHHSAIPRWPDHTAGPVCKCVVLGRRGVGVCLVHDREP